MKPKVSIIVPSYNAEKWIEKCVMSALQQTYENCEVVVVDNESVDNTVAIVERIKTEFPKLIVDSAKNIYPNCWDEARARGYEIATGEYLTTLASDDFLSQDYVKNCMTYILSAPERIMAFQSHLMSVYEAASMQPPHMIAHSYKSLEEFKVLSLGRCCVNSPTVFYNRKLYEQGLLETIPEQFGGAADYDLYCRLAAEGVFIYPSDRWLGYHYRWNEGQATWNVQREGINYDKMIQEKWGSKWNL